MSIEHLRAGYFAVALECWCVVLHAHHLASSLLVPSRLAPSPPHPCTARHLPAYHPTCTPCSRSSLPALHSTPTEARHRIALHQQPTTVAPPAQGGPPTGHRTSPRPPTAGVVTKVALQCPPKPRSVQVAFAAVDSYRSVLKVLKEARYQLGEILSAFEFLDSVSMAVVEEQLGAGSPGVRSPLGQKYPFYVLVETSGSDEGHDQEKLDRFTTVGTAVLHCRVTGYCDTATAGKLGTVALHCWETGYCSTALLRNWILQYCTAGYCSTALLGNWVL
jgi:hypothetical protein